MATEPDIREYIGVTPKSAFDLAEIVENGLPLNSLALLKEKGLTASEVSGIVISPRTLKHRRARGEHLSRKETDRLVRVARVVSLLKMSSVIARRGCPGCALLMIGLETAALS